jgi:hypothetical protein
MLKKDARHSVPVLTFNINISSVSMFRLHCKPSHHHLRALSHSCHLLV